MRPRRNQGGEESSSSSSSFLGGKEEEEEKKGSEVSSSSSSLSSSSSSASTSFASSLFSPFRSYRGVLSFVSLVSFFFVLLFSSSLSPSSLSLPSSSSSLSSVATSLSSFSKEKNTERDRAEEEREGEREREEETEESNYIRKPILDEASSLGLSEQYPVYELGEMEKVAQRDVAGEDEDLKNVVENAARVQQREAAKRISSSSFVSGKENEIVVGRGEEGEEETDEEEEETEEEEEEEGEENASEESHLELDDGAPSKDENAIPESIFVDQLEYNKAPMIQVLPESHKLKYRSIVLQHERHYRSHPSRLFVPRLKPDVKLSLKEFADRFIRTSQPVIIPYAAMRHLGFKTRSFTLKELLKVYPNHKPMVYKYGGGGKGEVDLGPAIAALDSNSDLKKTKIGRNFPRNMKVYSAASLSKLTIQEPPFVIPDQTSFMSPSVWFGAKTSSTKFHSDCCDNYAMMVTGTKIWTVSPPSEARILHPKCTGGLCWVKLLEHPDEHATTEQMMSLRDKLQRYTFELRPEEMLYLPCGWFHHVENKDPTIMVNWWTKNRPMFLQYLENKVVSFAL